MVYVQVKLNKLNNKKQNMKYLKETHELKETLIGNNTLDTTFENSSLRPDSQTSAPFENNYDFDYGDVYMYPGYSFERPVYLYVWEILVLLTILQNILIVSVFIRKKMRNPTNSVLSAIAVSDSLTGLVTLPTYIMVFQRYQPFDYEGEYDNEIEKLYNDSFFSTPSADSYFMNNSTSITSSTIETSNLTGPLNLALNSPSEIEPADGYTLSKVLCQNFMISKYFLSKSFHTVSIFLTLFLGIHRYVSMAYPYKYDRCFNRMKVVTLTCIFTFLLSPILHAFHLFRNKAEDGLCQWSLSGSGCGKDCIYLWISFIVRHFIPCVTLVAFTVLFIQELRKGEKTFLRIDSSSSQYLKRISENRRISFVVTIIVVVRLIPEIPYSMFLLFNSIDVTINDGKQIDLETNRIFHLCYELCLICSFLAHFYIYLIFNKTFRKRFYKTFLKQVRVKFNDSVAMYSFPSWYPARKKATRRLNSVRPPGGISITETNEENDNRESLIKLGACDTDREVQKDTDSITEIPLTNNCQHENHDHNA